MGGHGAQSPAPRRRNRRLPDSIPALIGATLISLVPLAASAGSGLSISLASVLAPPPASDYAADTEVAGAPLGSFDAAAYAGSLRPSDGSGTVSTLTRDGFVAGYGGGWTQESTGRGLQELVVAFSGGSGARSWLATAETAARSSDLYQGTIPVAGVGPYYGIHYADPAGPVYADVVSFVKGNDFFTVGFVSSTDDLAGVAAAQARKQFASAPPDSIPPAQWPENLRLLAGGVDALKVAALAAIAVTLIGFLASFALLIYVRRRATGEADGKLIWDGKAPPRDG